MTRKSVGAADGNNPQRRDRAPIFRNQALNYLVDRSIAAASENHVDAVVGRFSRLGRS